MEETEKNIPLMLMELVMEAGELYRLADMKMFDNKEIVMVVEC